MPTGAARPRRAAPTRASGFAVAWCAVLFGLATWPHLVGTFAPPAGYAGFGSIMFVNDFAQYEAAMAEGARTTSWLVHDHFTPEPHRPALMFPLYVGLGKLAGVAGVPSLWLYRGVEAVGRIAVLATIAWVLGQLIPGRGRLALVLGTVGAGPGLWAGVAQALLGVSDPYAGNGSYELNNLALLFAPPHVSFGMAVTLGIVVLLVRSAQAWSGRHASALALGGVLLCLLHPFNAVTLILAAGAIALASSLEPEGGRGLAGCLRRSAVGAAVVLSLAAAPFILYNALTFGRDPFWGAAYGAQNVLPSPAPHELLVDLGLLLLVGVPGLVGLWQLGGAPRRLALVVGLMLLLMYTPVPFQRRFAFGVAPLLGAITGAALAAWAAAGTTSGRARRLTLAGALILTLGSPVLAYAGFALSVWSNAPIAVYRASPDLEAARSWLAEHTTADDVVLASWDVANYLGGQVPGRTTGGHPVATLRAGQRRAEAAATFASPLAQEAAVARERPTYLVSTGAAEPIFLSDAAPVFRRGTVAIVRVARPSDGGAT